MALIIPPQVVPREKIINKVLSEILEKISKSVPVEVERGKKCRWGELQQVTGTWCVCVSVCVSLCMCESVWVCMCVSVCLYMWVCVGEGESLSLRHCCRQVQAGRTDGKRVVESAATSVVSVFTLLFSIYLSFLWFLTGGDWARQPRQGTIIHLVQHRRLRHEFRCS